MTELYLRPAGNILVPLPAFADALGELTQGATYRSHLTRLQGRSASHNRYVFGVLLRYLHKFVDHEMPFDAFRSWITIRAGHFLITPDGDLIAKSWAFGKMDQDQFNDLVNRIIDYSIESIIPDTVSKADVHEAIEHLILL